MNAAFPSLLPTPQQLSTVTQDGGGNMMSLVSVNVVVLNDLSGCALAGRRIAVKRLIKGPDGKGESSSTKYYSYSFFFGRASKRIIRVDASMAVLVKD